MSGYIILREGNRHFHQRSVALFLRVVGPKRTEFDWWCWMFKAFALWLVLTRYPYGVRFQARWRQRDFIHLFRRFRSAP